MKLSIITLFSLVTFASFARAEAPDVILRSVVDIAGNHVYSLSADSGKKSSWVTEGDFFAGYEIIEFKPKEGVLVIRKDGEDYRIPLAAGRVGRDESETDSQDELPDAVEIEMSNLRQISQAALIFAHKNDGRLPSGETIHEVAQAFAAGGIGLNEPSFWLSTGEIDSAPENRPTRILAEDEASLDPVFAEQELFAFDFAAGLPTKGLPSTTPIAWTRGLREDGTWDESGPYGSAGGIIVFLGGNVTTFKDVRHEAGGIFRLPDGTYSSNILEALPPEVRVVGSGPGSLHGSSGRRDVGPLNSAQPASLP